MRDGFLRIAAVSPSVNVADVDYNTAKIEECLDKLEAEQVDVAVFPEMCITAYTCGDLFHSSTLLDAAERALGRLIDKSRNMHVDFAVGLPIRASGTLYNCAAFISNGNLSLHAKSFIPNYNEFYERRWWSALSVDENVGVNVAGHHATITSGDIIESHGALIGIEICEDLWVPVPPSCTMALKGAEVILNLSASNALVGKREYLKQLIIGQSGRCVCAYAYSGSGFGESSTDLVFDGKALIAENGTMLADSPRWSLDGVVSIADIDIEALRRDRLHLTTFSDCRKRLGINSSPTPADNNDNTKSDLKYRTVNPQPFVPGSDIDERCREITSIQVSGLSRRMSFIHADSLVVGISGGLDSTLALLVAVDTFDRLGIDRKGITGITMPGFGTTSRTHTNAVRLMEMLKITRREIPIGDAVKQHFADIGHDPSIHDITYENSQARERTQILMDAANQTGGIVLGTGDLSELALGWATYNGDHMSMYGINSGIPKTLVRHLVKWYARNRFDGEISRILLDILDTPVSPELLPATADDKIAQVTEDLVGPYELHDFFLYYTLRYGFSPERIYLLACKAFHGSQYDNDTIKRWLKNFFKRFFSQQFKRSCLPDGPKIGSVCLSPRGDWRMPSDASSSLWK